MPYNTADLKKDLEKRFGAGSSSVIDEIVHLLRDKIGEGRSVTLNGLGTFSLRLCLDKKNVKDYDNVRSQDIRLRGVRFVAAKPLYESFSHQTIHQVDGDAVRRQLTTDDRWVTLYTYVLNESDDKDLPLNEIMLTASVYKRLTGCTEYTARKELKSFAEDGRLRQIRAPKNLMYVMVE